MLRASYASKTSFPGAVVKAFQTLASASKTASATAPSPALRSSTKPSAPSDILPSVQTTGKTLASLDRCEFTKLLECLCNDLPKSLQQRTLDALALPSPSQQQRQPAGASDAVALAEFQRSVEVCLLLEGANERLKALVDACAWSHSAAPALVLAELVDAVDDLFRAVDKSDAGEVRASVLVLALETAGAGTHLVPQTAGSTTPPLDAASLVAALKAFVLPAPPGLSTAAAADDSDMERIECFSDRTLRLTDLYDAMFHVVFAP